MTMRVLVGMSGGVDSSVAAALALRAGWEVEGVTLKLWGGVSDSGCCSVADVEDARRVADQLGIVHHVFNFTDEFEEKVVDPYVNDHSEGRTPNPCIECNRHLKFHRLLRRADQLGFDAVATGHHARIVEVAGPTSPNSTSTKTFQLRRGADWAKDQSYVLHMLNQATMARVQFPVGELTKEQVREVASCLGLRTAAKPDSQDTCFVLASGGREAFLGPRLELHPGELVDGSGAVVGQVDAVEMVTVGQRRGLGGGGGSRRFALEVDIPRRRVTVGPEADLLVNTIAVGAMTWTDHPLAHATTVQAQCSAHGRPLPGTWHQDESGSESVGVGHVRLIDPARRVAPGQSVVLYEGDVVLGGGLAV